MFRTKRSLNAVCVLAVVAAVAGWSVRRANASSTVELCACICTAVKDYLKPVKITVNGNTSVRLNGSHDSGSTANPPTTDKPPTDLQAFAMKVRECVKKHANGQITNQPCDCTIDGQNFTLIISADVDGDAVIASGSADIVIAIAGNQADTSTKDGKTATATNNSNGGAAVAVGGNGGGNDNNPGKGGKGTATSKGGDSSAAGGAGGDPSNNANAGGKGGAAKANQLGWLPAFPGVGIAESAGVDGIQGFHGGGAWAKAGRIAPGGGTAARSGHGGLRVNDGSNTNVP